MKSTFVFLRREEKVCAKWTNIAVLLIESIITQAVWMGVLCLVQNASARIELVPLTPYPNAINTAAEGLLTWSAPGRNLIVNGDFESGGFLAGPNNAPPTRTLLSIMGTTNHHPPTADNRFFRETPARSRSPGPKDRKPWSRM
jgi:hypothetical protein